MMPRWWTQVIPHWSKPVDRTAPRVTLMQTTGSERRPRVHAAPLIVTNGPSGGDAGDGRLGRGRRELLYVPFNFAGNLKPL